MWIARRSAVHYLNLGAPGSTRMKGEPGGSQRAGGASPLPRVKYPGIPDLLAGRGRFADESGVTIFFLYRSWYQRKVSGDCLKLARASFFSAVPESSSHSIVLLALILDKVVCLVFGLPDH